MAGTLRPQSKGKGAQKMYVMTGREDQGLWNNHQRRKKARSDEKNFSPDKKFLKEISDYSLSGYPDNEPDF